MNYKEHIIEVKDYPKEGISFKILHPLWQDKKVFKSMISDYANHLKSQMLTL